MKVVRQLESGAPPGAVSDASGVPLPTVRRWGAGRIPELARRRLAGIETCPTCGSVEHWFPSLPAEQYGYLLGVYLGDGCLYTTGRQTRLQVALDVAYPWIVISINDAIEDLRGRRACEVYRRSENSVTLVSYWKPWRCLFPQHGRGKKHERVIALEPWQQSLVDQAPQAFLRGLIHTDGWRGLNRVHVKGRDYAYPRYQFSNRSDDIRELFTATCDALGIAWRPWGRWHISVARREAVAAMDAFIGPKC